MQITKPRV